MKKIYFLITIILILIKNLLAISNKSIFNELMLELNETPLPIYNETYNNTKNKTTGGIYNYLYEINNFENISKLSLNYGNTLFITHVEEYYLTKSYDDYFDPYNYEIITKPIETILSKYSFDNIYQQITVTNNSYYKFSNTNDKAIEDYQVKTKKITLEIKDLQKKIQKIQITNTALIQKIFFQNTFFKIMTQKLITENGKLIKNYNENIIKNTKEFMYLNKKIKKMIKENQSKTEITEVPDYQNLGRYNYNNVKGENIMFSGLYFDYCTLWTFRSIVKSFIKSHNGNPIKYPKINLFINATAIMKNNFQIAKDEKYNQYKETLKKANEKFNFDYKIIDNGKIIEQKGENSVINLYIIRNNNDINLFPFYFNQKFFLKLTNEILNLNASKFINLETYNMKRFLNFKFSA